MQGLATSPSSTAKFDDTTARFKADLSAALTLAGRAPSSHNSQPWAVRLLGVPSESASGGSARPLNTGLANARVPGVLVALDQSRAITALAAHATEMSLSCGLFLHLFVTAMNGLGWTHDLSWAADLESDPTLPAHWTPLVIVRFEPERLGGCADRFAKLVNERVTNRAPFGSPLSSSEREYLSAARATLTLPSPASTELCLSSSSSQSARIAELVERHAARDFAQREAWAETYRYVSFDTASATLERREDGFSIEHLMGSLSWMSRQVLRLGLSPTGMTWLSPFGVPQHLARALAKLVADTPDLVCVTAEQPETLSSGLHAGSLIMDLWLRATELGLALHPVSVLVQYEDSRAELRRVLGLTGEPMFLARVGRPLHPFPRSPRRRNVWSDETFITRSAQG